MGFVLPDRPDVFISYAQVNDRPVPGWVSSFVDWLEQLLAMEIGRADQLSVFRDFQLPIGANLADDIKQKVHDSATLLIIMSPAYRESVWTANELKWFREHLGNRIQNAGVRIFPVEFDRVERPPELGERLSSVFWELDPVRKRTRTLGFPKPIDTEPADRPFFNLLKYLCQDIAEELKRQKAAIAAAVAPPKTGPIVFLAHATEDLQLQREQVRRYLELEGFRVVPDHHYSDDVGFRAAVAADLAPAVLFVQLLSQDPGPALAESADRRATVQHELATVLGKPAMLWRRADLPLTPEIPANHRTLLDKASTADLEMFNQGVVERVKRLLAPARAKQVAPDGFECTVFVNPSEEARPLAERIGQELTNRRMYAVLPPMGGLVEKNRLAYEANVEDCDGLLLVSSPATTNWLRSQLLQTQKVVARRGRPLPIFSWTKEGPPDGPEFDTFLNQLRPGGR